LVVEIESGLFRCVQFHVFGWKVECAVERGTGDGKNMEQCCADIDIRLRRSDSAASDNVQKTLFNPLFCGCFD
jgi:hypothetical protein